MFDFDEGLRIIFTRPWSQGVTNCPYPNLGKRDVVWVRRVSVSEQAEALPARFNRSQEHHESYLKLIRWELDDELSMTESRLREWPDGRLAANGIALFDLVAKTDGWLFGQRIIKLQRRDRQAFGMHRFRQGDIVMLSRRNPLTEKPVEAIVSNRSRFHIRIVVPEVPNGLRKDTWSCLLYTSPRPRD